VNLETMRVQTELYTAWPDIRTSIRRMYSASEIRPSAASDVFHAVNSCDGEARFEVAPVVFRVPERARCQSANLYVVVEGWIVFTPPCEEDPRMTTLRFSTAVGYFRQKSGKLDHVFGVHYDMEEVLPGHPVFHAQLASQATLIDHINERYNSQFELNEDNAKLLLRSVRVPIAQMDVFSVITQLGADHLLSSNSSPEVFKAFSGLRRACDFFIGAANHLPYLNSEPARYCYRSTHWYERADKGAIAGVRRDFGTGTPRSSKIRR